MSRIEWLPFLMSQLWSLPYGLACAVGVITSIVYLRKHSTPAFLTLLAFGLILFGLCSGIALQFWLVGLGGNEMSPVTIGRVFGIAAFIRSMMSAGGLLLLTIAAFIGRTVPTPLTVQK